MDKLTSITVEFDDVILFLSKKSTFEERKFDEEEKNESLARNLSKLEKLINKNFKEPKRIEETNTWMEFEIEPTSFEEAIRIFKNISKIFPGINFSFQTKTDEDWDEFPGIIMGFESGILK